MQQDGLVIHLSTPGHLVVCILFFTLTTAAAYYMSCVLWSCRIKTRSRPSAFEYLLHIFTNV